MTKKPYLRLRCDGQPPTKVGGELRWYEIRDRQRHLLHLRGTRQCNAGRQPR